jgi:hypothetical protein
MKQGGEGEGQLSYDQRSRKIAEAAFLLDCNGLVVPNARRNCQNLVLFCDRLRPGAVEAVRDHGIIDWASWQGERWSAGGSRNPAEDEEPVPKSSVALAATAYAASK